MGLFCATRTTNFSKINFFGPRSQGRCQLFFSDSNWQDCRKKVPKLVRSSKKSDISDFICHELKVVLTQLKSIITEILTKQSRIPRPQIVYNFSWFLAIVRLTWMGLNGISDTFLFILQVEFSEKANKFTTLISFSTQNTFLQNYERKSWK